jgi:hypothetical protein
VLWSGYIRRPSPPSIWLFLITEENSYVTCFLTLIKNAFNSQFILLYSTSTINHYAQRTHGPLKRWLHISQQWHQLPHPELAWLRRWIFNGESLLDMTPHGWNTYTRYARAIDLSNWTRTGGLQVALELQNELNPIDPSSFIKSPEQPRVGSRRAAPTFFTSSNSYIQPATPCTESSMLMREQPHDKSLILLTLRRSGKEEKPRDIDVCNR